MFSKTTLQAIKRNATLAGIHAALLATVFQVESAGVAGAIIRGEWRSTIRFEGHYFDKRLSPENRKAARAAGLASPVAGRIKNPASQQARYDLLDRAAAIDRNAAYESCSWGGPQIMGAHWKALGYKSVLEFVHACDTGIDGQVALLVRFLIAFKLMSALKARNWASLAKGYNGTLYDKAPGRANDYDTLLANAFRRWNDFDWGSVDAAVLSGPAKVPGSRVDWNEPAVKRSPEVDALIENVAAEGRVSTTEVATGVAGVGGVATAVNETVRTVKETGLTLMDAGPWVLLALVIAGASIWIIRERRAKKRLALAAKEAV